MSSRYAKIVSAPIPQTEPLDARQVMNSAGGYVYALTDLDRLDRFLVLGSDSSSYYQSAKALTKENSACVTRCYTADPAETVKRIVDVSVSGRAPKNDPAIFALALGAVHADVKTRQLALAAIPAVCRTGTHIFQFVEMARALGKGWGRALKRAIARWYDDKDVDKLAYQMIKYRNRVNYTHKRLIDCSGADGKKELARGALYRWALGKDPVSHEQSAALPRLVGGHLLAMEAEGNADRIIELIKEHNLPWEAIPTSATTNPDVWRAMLPHMGLTALIRNLGGMTQYGTLKPLSDETLDVVRRLTDDGELRKARIHPFNVLMAHAVYRSGQSVRGSRSWKPVPTIVDALDDAFYKSFKHIEPTGKRTLIGLDVSGSMSASLMGSPLSVCEGAAAMAMTTMRSEKNWHVFAFNNRFSDLNLSAKDSLTDVLRRTRDVNFGGTDCALPMIYALENGLSVDCFFVYTDNETHSGHMHPAFALKKYRQRTGIQAKLVVVGLTATKFSIADPNDANMLDIVGWDSSAPSMMADFART